VVPPTPDAFGLNRRQYEVQARQTEQLLEQTRLAQNEHARAAALEERGRIARDLHDVLAHSLGALSVQLEVAELCWTIAVTRPVRWNASAVRDDSPFKG